ncbi:MAG: hypothetical protein KDD19_29115 [Phaeodactylibacter sp.]|nr:hypothetical protein [Phaeodactylibacter sp.]MCB9052472.1 hypothetical protein [Lewinellaceae bacterium]
MKQVRILSVAFDTEIAAHETPAFRGAVIEKVGLEHELFHNHNNDPSAKVAYHYRYPVVQYKRQGRRPSIVFIDEGVGQAQHFFMQPDWSLEFAGRRYNASISDLKVRTYDLGVTGQPHYYTLRNWAGLNQENYERFSQLESLAEQIKMLENILAGHILGFANGVGHRFRRRFDLSILHILGRRFRPFEGVGMLTFDLRFKADVLLPGYVGLGRGVSRGFGVVGEWKPKSAGQKFANN